MAKVCHPPEDESVLCQIFFDFQFNFCRAVKDSRVAFFLTFFQHLYQFSLVGGRTASMKSFYFIFKGKVVYKPVLECLPKIKYFSGTASTEYNS